MILGSGGFAHAALHEQSCKLLNAIYHLNQEDPDSHERTAEVRVSRLIIPQVNSYFLGYEPVELV
jgi:hypothetical protein